MDRKYIVVGDRPESGGAVLPFEAKPGFMLNGHRQALVGGRVFCQACKSVGHIAKAGGLRRYGFLTGGEMALEGDVVECGCTVPPLLVSTLQSFSSYNDLGSISGVYQPWVHYPNWYQPNAEALAKSKAVVERFVQYPPEAFASETICPNMTNQEFRDNTLASRDAAVRILEIRHLELLNIGPEVRDRLHTWFGASDSETQHYLRSGFGKCLPILKNLTGANFVRYSEELVRYIGCEPSDLAGRAAAVCKPDTATHTIAITPVFCALRPMSAGQDSVVSTLIHETVHFNDTFGADDIVGGFTKSLELAKTDTASAKRNADNLTGYAVWGMHYGTY